MGIIVLFAHKIRETKILVGDGEETFLLEQLI